MIRIIIPVYNVEAYLADAVESLIRQSAGFEKNIEIHLLDDHSTDTSPMICDEYAKKYPDNILVTHFPENHGVSRMRNEGIKAAKKAKADMIGFLDSDDMLGENCIDEILGFCERHRDVKIIASKLYFFGAREGEPLANSYFDGTEVVDIRKDYERPRYYIGGTFLRYPAYKRLEFDEHLNFWEDALALNRVILAEGAYGLCAEARYMYRRRENNDSLVDRSWSDPYRYDGFLKDGYGKLYQYSKLRYFKVIPYVQFLVANHVRLYLLEENREAVMAVLDTPEALETFRQRLQMTLKPVDEEVLIRVKTKLPVLEELFSIKRGEKVRAKRVLTEDDMVVNLAGQEMGRLTETHVTLLGYSAKEGYEGMIKGRYATRLYAMKKEDHIFALHEGERIESVPYRCRKEIWVLDHLMRNYKRAGFAIAIPSDWEQVRFGIRIGETDILLNEVDLAALKEKWQG